MRIGMFGGTFNPPHEGHVSAARACVKTLALDQLLIIPDRLPPHKPLPEGSASPDQRLAMCRLAFAGVPNCSINDMELRRPGPSYTVDTLRLLRQQYPDAALWLMIGTDMLLSIDRWHCTEEILRLARLAVVSREESDRILIEEKAAALASIYGVEIDIIDNPVVEVSSTEVRDGARAEQLPKAVADYIRKNGLYAVSLDTLRAFAERHLPAKRLAHTLGCERLCAELAAIWGADAYTVRAAALLHDCTKPLSPAEQLKLCDQWGIITDYPQESFFDLIHADTAAELARRELRMPEAVCRAIARHTVGAADMTTEEKILYIADLCEETRTYDGAEGLRLLAKQDLHAALIAALQRTAAFVRNKGKEPYYVTLQTLERLTKGGQ
ncbi:MAG: nicotinate (nicotinamide) nucleotide adenylyltransferase [Clostridiaceae bacterium]|nr:nicotinate (nicotinamide) nucleotide adenylyltransferase [Clostridiaceae bacterium]